MLAGMVGSKSLYVLYSNEPPFFVTNYKNMYVAFFQKNQGLWKGL
jgi:hypothetical protein